MREIVLLTALVATAGVTAEPTKPPAPQPAASGKPLTRDETQKALYATGFLVFRRSPLAQSNLSKEDLQTVLKGFADAALSKPLDFDPDIVMPKLEQLFAEQRERFAVDEKKRGVAFLEKAAMEPRAQKLPSGLVYIEVSPGHGRSPRPTDTVQVNYRGELISGREFDSTYKRGVPTQLALTGVIHCWAEAIVKMKVGGKSKLVCPSELAYGERGVGGTIPPGSALIYEVELLSILSADAGK